jgi:hypothetical protein
MAKTFAHRLRRFFDELVGANALRAPRLDETLRTNAAAS